MSLKKGRVNMGLFSKLKEGLTKTRDNIVSGIDNIFNGFSSIDDDFYEELEETLICLLYTSPSPRDPKTSRMPSSA